MPVYMPVYAEVIGAVKLRGQVLVTPNQCYWNTIRKSTLYWKDHNTRLNGMNRFIVFSSFFYFCPSYHILLRLTMHIIHSRVGAFISRYKSKQHWQGT